MNEIIAFATGAGMAIAIGLIVAIRHRSTNTAADSARLDYLASSEVGVFCVKGVWGALSNGVLLKQNPDLRNLLDDVRGQK